MPLNVAKELTALQKLSVSDLRERYVELFQETTQARNRPWLIKRIIWRMQSLEQGGLSERALQRARELAATSDLRVTAPTRHRTTEGATTKTIECPVAPSRTPLPGMLITRRRDGQQHLCPGPASETPKGKIPRISRLMALAIHCDELLRTGQVANQSALAEYAQITPARLTQILTLLNLAPDIQEEILFLPSTTTGRGEVQEKHVRKIAMELDWGMQTQSWSELQ